MKRLLLFVERVLDKLRSRLAGSAATELSALASDQIIIPTSTSPSKVIKPTHYEFTDEELLNELRPYDYILVNSPRQCVVEEV